MTFEFHVSRESRDRYEFDEALFALTGNVVFADYAAARRFAQKMNVQRDLAADPGSAVRAGDINAMGLVDEILHFVLELYRRERNPNAISGALAHLATELGQSLDATLATFAEHFPAVAAYRGGLSGRDYLDATTNGVPNREIALEELLMVWLANGNAAFAPYGELFDDDPLATGSDYPAAIEQLQAWFRMQPGFGPDDEDLVTLLRRPAQEAPDSLSEQLRWISERWGFVAERFGDRMVISLDVLSEEERAVWMRFNASQGGAEEGDTASDTAALHGFATGAGADAEIERFSQDLDWMPRVVLLAKSTYVWLDQLSRAYGHPIWRLDQIPDEELDRIAASGFTGLWLIGLWERSRASQRIKQLRGNPEAVASAYSLMDYRIADDLGGDEAYQSLRDRAWRCGIRLASDMVPNHMGIDSRWVVEHPEWFMQRSDPPYPVYSFNGPNLSSDERVGIYIEDHYYDNSDAAVTFKRADRWSGQERNIYHGNDGTSMPWNDTAQLDFLKPEVREAVIQTILHVARQFPIIRFDAAMTLAKRHIARLWYPEPGSGGAIPSRAEYAMKKEDFEAAMPVEFWREVVDRVAEEAPDTLLLAEAFWLMEGYFVRTLGMHRVYNSAFMNMMRDEKNAEYRLVIKNTLEFDPQILKRYVNFMNNPDERTAVDQFGTGDKYFGVATMLATMPGLPMFGHGQVEGFAERYGMEYRRAYVDETPDAELIARHEREIFPLLHRRAMFAEVDGFALYDFVTADGAVNEDVFAYSNRRDGERSLVVFHNRFAETSGWIRSAAVTGRSLAEGLAVSSGGADDFISLRDSRAGLECLRSQRELAEHGLYLELKAYETQAYLELRDVHDADGRWARLAARLAGRGVPSLADELRDLELAPLHDALRSGDRDGALREAAALLGVAGSAKRAPAEAVVPGVRPAEWDGAKSDIAQADVPQPEGAKSDLAQAIEDFVAAHQPRLAKGAWIAEWRARDALPDADLVEIRLSPPPRPLTELLADGRFRRSIGVNEHEGVTWFSQEQFEHAVEALDLPDAPWLVRAAADSGYRLDKLESRLSGPPKWASTQPARPAPRPSTALARAFEPAKPARAEPIAPAEPAPAESTPAEPTAPTEQKPPAEAKPARK